MNKKTQDRLKALFTLYTQGMPKKMDEIEQELNTLKKNWQLEKWQDFHRNVHSMCGSSGTYGYIEVSQLARALEIKAKDFLECPPDEAAIVEMEQKLNVLKEAVKASSPDEAIKRFLNLPESPLTEKKLIYLLHTENKFHDDLKQELSVFGYNIIKMTSFENLIEECTKKMPAAVIADSDLLTKDHAKDLNKFQQNHQGSLPIIFTSNDGDFKTRLKAVMAGGRAFFVRPVDIGRLTEQLDRFCESPSQESYRILIIEDSVMLAEYYALILQQAGLATSVITDPIQLFDALVDFQPDLILMDIYMPECTGAELAAVLRQHGGYDSIPIVFLSVEADRFKQLHALNFGGDDFLTKPIQAEHLISAVKIRAARYKILRSYIMKDPLTGVYNHTVIQQELETEVKRAVRLSLSVAVVMIDIDKFKQINDNYGHPVGDLVIKNLCRLLQKRLRKTDILGRYGGEEFMVVLPNTDAQKALDLINEIRQSFAEIHHSSAGNQLQSSFSAGIACFPDFTDVNIMVKSADDALYRAKHAGRNCVMLAEADKLG